VCGLVLFVLEVEIVAVSQIGFFNLFQLYMYFYFDKILKYLISYS